MCYETGHRAASLERSSGEPCAHHKSSKIESLFRNIRTCFDTAFQRLIPFEQANAHRDGHRNPEHASTARPKRSLELGRVGFCASPRIGSLPKAIRKTGIYNMMRGQGSIGRITRRYLNVGRE